jgi:hypothetical protein
MRRLWSGVGALASLIALCAAGAALASSSHKAKADIQKGSGNCGAKEPARPVLGTVSFKRSGNAVAFKVVIKHGEPATHYQIVLYGPACKFFSPPAFVLTTNKKGVGKGTGSVTVPASDTEFFLDPYNGVANDTPYVTLLP